MRPESKARGALGDTAAKANALKSGDRPCAFRRAERRGAFRPLSDMAGFYTGANSAADGALSPAMAICGDRGRDGWRHQFPDAVLICRFQLYVLPDKRHDQLLSGVVRRAGARF
jgi:hypothetical protein